MCNSDIYDDKYNMCNSDMCKDKYNIHDTDIKYVMPLVNVNDIHIRT